MLSHFLKPTGQVHVIGELKGLGPPMLVGDGYRFHKLHQIDGVYCWLFFSMLRYLSISKCFKETKNSPNIKNA